MVVLPGVILLQKRLANKYIYSGKSVNSYVHNYQLSYHTNVGCMQRDVHRVIPCRHKSTCSCTKTYALVISDATYQPNS